MTTRWRRTTACERAAQWISLALDAELGALERAALARHLGRCGACHERSVALEGITELIRSEPELGPRIPGQVLTPGWARARRRTRFQAAFVAFAAVAAGVFAGVVALTGPPASGRTVSVGDAAELRLMAQVHVQIEPTVFVVAPDTSAPSFASRVLL